MKVRYSLLFLAIALAGSVGPALAVQPRGSINTIHVTVTGTSDIYLAGMPAGSTASLVDTALAQSPTPVPGVCLTPGDSVSFAATGLVGNGNGFPAFPPDGDPNGLQGHFTGAENGMSDIFAPLNGLLGVFLSADQPDLNPAPATLDFSPTGLGLNFSVLAPELQQVFFIGDGQTDAAVLQKFVVPAGATRLFLGPLDGYEWSNNEGSFEVDVNSTCDVTPARSTTWSGIKGLYR